MFSWVRRSDTNADRDVDVDGEHKHKHGGGSHRLVVVGRKFAIAVESSSPLEKNDVMEGPRSDWCSEGSRRS